jgi:sulfite oxidase
VKWLERIEVRAEPWDGHFQATAYRLLEPGETPAPGVGIPLGEIAVNADILESDDGDRVAPAALTVHGYAFAGGERRIVRVDVSADGGRTWTPAVLLDDLGRWAWRMWRAEVTLAPGPAEIVARAWDSAAGTQPEDAATVWNPKGYANNSWARVRVTAGPESA